MKHLYARQTFIRESLLPSSLTPAVLTDPKLESYTAPPIGEIHNRVISLPIPAKCIKTLSLNCQYSYINGLRLESRESEFWLASLEMLEPHLTEVQKIVYYGSLSWEMWHVISGFHALKSLSIRQITSLGDSYFVVGKHHSDVQVLVGWQSLAELPSLKELNIGRLLYEEAAGLARAIGQYRRLEILSIRTRYRCEPGVSTIARFCHHALSRFPTRGGFPSTLKRLTIIDSHKRYVSIMSVGSRSEQMENLESSP